MSFSFAAVNLSVEDKAYDAEEHSRELQIESAFKCLDMALRYQKNMQFKEARKQYKELFKINVITNNLTLISPNIRTLKYLAFRNRGLLYFDEVRSQFTSHHKKLKEKEEEDGEEEENEKEKYSWDFDKLEDLYDSLMFCVEDLIESLNHNEPDVLVINLLLSLSEFMDSDRLRRFILDLELTKEEETAFNYEAVRLEDPMFLRYVGYENEILDKIGVKSLNYKNPNEMKLNLPDLSSLLPLKNYISERKERLEQSWTKTINLDTFTWKSVSMGFLNILSKSKAKIRFKDPYNSKDFPVYKISYKVTKKNEKELKDEENEDKNHFEVSDKAPIIISLSDHEEDDLQPIDVDPPQAQTRSASKRDHEDAPQQQRSSKRLKAELEHGDLSVETLRRAKIFIQNINDSLSNLPFSTTSYQLDANEFINNITDSTSKTNFISIFYNRLKTWDVKSTELLFQASSNQKLSPSGNQILELINSTSFHDSNIDDATVPKLGDELVREYVLKMNKENPHFNEAKTIFLELLLRKNEGCCLITDFLIDNEIFRAIEVLLITNEPTFFSLLSDSVDADDEFSVYVSMFEILGNMLLDMREKLKNNEIASKNMNDFKNGIVLFENNIYKWRKLLDCISLSEELELRYRWCLLLLLKSEDGNSESLNFFQDLMKEYYIDFQQFSEKTATTEIRLLNYDHIPSISLRMIKSQTDRMQLISLFDKAFINPDERNSQESIQSMECILMNEKTENSQQISLFTEKQLTNMSHFINSSSLITRLRLWRYLFSAYLANCDVTSYSHGLVYIIKSLSDQLELKSKEVCDFDFLITYLSYAGEFIQGFVKLLGSVNWELHKDTVNSEELLCILVRVFVPLFLCYYTFEVNNPPVNTNGDDIKASNSAVGGSGDRNDPDVSGMETCRIASRSFMKLRNTFVSCWCCIIVCYHSILSASSSTTTTTDSDLVIEHTCDMISILHEEIGSLHFCDSADSHFLKLCQHFLKLAEQNSKGVFERDHLQLINCLYHICISSTSTSQSNTHSHSATTTFMPRDHHTSTGTELTIESAIQFSEFFFPLLERRRKFLISSNQFKPDLKLGLEAIYKAIGKPLVEEKEDQVSECNAYILYNWHVLSAYLSDSLIDMSLTKMSVLGDLCLPFKKPTEGNDVTQVYERGIYFYQAVVAMNYYQLRKKQSLGRASDLEFIIEMLQLDLITTSVTNAHRLETWILLGQCYGLFADLDMSFTADKLNSPDRKSIIACNQRKSMLCYFMAVSLYLKDNVIADKNTDAGLLNGLFPSLAMSLYRNLAKPMDGLAFLTNGNTIISPEFSKFVLKLAYKFMKVSLTKKPKVWLNYYYLAKIQHKLKNIHPITILGTCLKACHLNTTGIESHYQLCSMIYKYYHSGELSTDQVFEIVESLTCESILHETIEKRKDADLQPIQLIIMCLNKLIQLDKKKWHHRLRYRLSKIQYNQANYTESLAALEPLLTLRQAGGTLKLINIWKTDIEPSGKHFQYTTQYSRHAIDVFDKLCDINSLRVFLRKLRRFGASMVGLYDVWEYGCVVFCQMSKEILDIPLTGFVDDLVLKLTYVEFNQNVDTMIRLARQREINEEELNKLILLVDIVEIRRLNNGFGPTSLVDDTLNCIFLKHYLDVTTADVTGEEYKAIPNQQQYITNSTGMIIGIVNDNTKDSEQGLTDMIPVDPPVKLRLARKEIIALGTSFIKSLEMKLKLIVSGRGSATSTNSNSNAGGLGINTDEYLIKVPFSVKESHLKHSINVKKNHEVKAKSEEVGSAIPTAPATPKTPNRNMVRDMMYTISDSEKEAIELDSPVKKSSEITTTTVQGLLPSVKNMNTTIEVKEENENENEEQEEKEKQQKPQEEESVRIDEAIGNEDVENDIFHTPNGSMNQNSEDDKLDKDKTNEIIFIEID